MVQEQGEQFPIVTHHEKTFLALQPRIYTYLQKNEPTYLPAVGLLLVFPLDLDPSKDTRAFLGLGLGFQMVGILSLSF